MNRIVAKNVHQDEQRGRLTVAACALHEQHDLLVDQPGEAVTEEPMYESDDLFVPFHGVVHELVPDRALSVRVPLNWAGFCDVVGPIVVRELPCP